MANGRKNSRTDEHFDCAGSYDAWLNRSTSPSTTDRRFVAVRSIDRTIAQRACCIHCGWPWEGHGQPPLADWQLVEDPDTVELREAKRFVLRVGGGGILAVVEQRHGRRTGPLQRCCRPRAAMRASRTAQIDSKQTFNAELRRVETDAINERA